MAAESMEVRGGPVEVNGRRSEVWSHFVVSRDGEGKETATCIHCQKSLGAETKKGTSHLRRHVEKGCTRPPKQPRLQGEHMAPPSDHPSSSTLQPAGSSLVLAPPPAQGSRGFNQEEEESGRSVLLAAPPAQGSWGFNQEESGAELARMITFHGYPSSIVDNECFRSFVRSLNPHFQMPSRAAVEGICHSRAEDAMNQLKETLSCCSGQISLATGTAETDQGRALYMVCQFIDDEWALHKRVMQVFKVVCLPTYNHSALLGAEEVCLNVPEVVQKQFLVPGTSSKLQEAVRRWGLQGRVFSVAWGQQLEACLEQKDFLDNLCSIIQLVGDEGPIEIPLVLCVGYTSDVLDSVAETLLESLDVRYEEACLKAVKGFNLSHEKRTQNYSELGLNHVGRYDKRWYTYYCGLEVLHKEYSDNGDALLEKPRLDQKQIVELLKRLAPGEMEAEVRNLLKPSRLKESVFTDLLRTIMGTIYRALERISAPNSPTANICLDVLMKVRGVLQSEAMDAGTVVAKAVAYAKHGGFFKDADVVLREVQDVLDNHLKQAYLFLSIPAVLDPRFKLEYVTSALNEVCRSTEAPTYTSRVKESIEDIFDEHRRKLRRSVINGEGTSRMAEEEIGTAAAMEVDGCSQEEGVTELERYLTDGRLVPGEEGDEAFDVLVWWKAHSLEYPTVASMARDALAMPASDLLSPEHIARIRSMMSNYCVTYPEAPSDD